MTEERAIHARRKTGAGAAGLMGGGGAERESLGVAGGCWGRDGDAAITMPFT